LFEIWVIFGDISLSNFTLIFIQISILKQILFFNLTKTDIIILLTQNLLQNLCNIAATFVQLCATLCRNSSMLYIYISKRTAECFCLKVQIGTSRAWRKTWDRNTGQTFASRMRHEMSNMPRARAWEPLSCKPSPQWADRCDTKPKPLRSIGTEVRTGWLSFVKRPPKRHCAISRE